MKKHPIRHLALSILPAATLLTLPEVAQAAPAESDDTEVESGRRYSSRGGPPNRDKWIYRWAPVNNMWEFGIYGGVWFPNRNHELFEPNAMVFNNGWQRMKILAGTVGGRVAYLPLRFLGIELEGGPYFARTRGTDVGVIPWTVRGHVIAQLGLWSITPFLLAGTGVQGISGPAAPRGLGNDQDVAIHFGGGVKFFINRWVMLRLDIRDVVHNRHGVGEGLASSPEILLGLSFTLRPKDKKKPRKGPGDRDGDRVPDNEDFCPDQFGEPPRGCPTVCLDDNDADGIANPEDKCPNDPETRNGFEDSDGCPDEVPPELEDLAGIMEGINFDTDKDTIKKESRPRLDNAVAVMKKYPDIRIRIVGHTDSQGGYRHNIDLSKRRAKSVKNYMVEQGIDESRIETEGVGPDQPVDTNDTAEGRARNRRIEFLIIDTETGKAVGAKDTAPPVEVKKPTAEDDPC